MKMTDLLQKRSATVAKMRGIADAPAGTAGDLSDDQAKTFDQLKTELATTEVAIERRTALDDAERRMTGTPVAGTGDDRFDDQCRKFSLRKAIASQVPDLRIDAGLEREVGAELAKRSGRPFQGVAIPLTVFHQAIEKRVITTTLPGGGPGSNIIATDFRGDQ